VHSASQPDDLVAGMIPLATGMSDEIDDGDAINYAAQFYASVANGQSVMSAHLSGQAALQLAGLAGAELPTHPEPARCQPRGAGPTESDPLACVKRYGVP
jgi:hypothetical protein